MRTPLPLVPLVVASLLGGAGLEGGITSATSGGSFGAGFGAGVGNFFGGLTGGLFSPTQGKTITTQQADTAALKQQLAAQNRPAPAIPSWAAPLAAGMVGGVGLGLAGKEVVKEVKARRAAQKPKKQRKKKRKSKSKKKRKR